MEYKTVDFFLGANTGHGFYSHFEQLQDPSARFLTYMIKGSAGSGKSTLMKHLADTIAPAQDGAICERIHCSSDPDSLDGVIWQDKKVAILDATPPHALEPQYAGALEQIVSFYPAFDLPKLQQKVDAIVPCSAHITRLHKRFCELLQCINLLLENNRTIITPAIDRDKLGRTMQNLANRTLKKHSAPLAPGKTQRRLLSAFTPQGLLTYENTVSTLCDQVYLLKDEYGVATDSLMRALHAIATQKGYNTILCYSPFDAGHKVDHLLIPALSLGFVSQNYFQPLSTLSPDRVINATRFYPADITRKAKQRLRFCRKMTSQLMLEGIGLLKQAKAEHDTLEDLYRDAVDFSVIRQIEQTLHTEIAAR